MKKNILVKTLAIGVIILFFGASVVSSINGDVSDVEIEILSTSTADWWNHDWECRKKITIDYSMVDDDLNDFPVLIYHESMDLADNAQSDGDDIVFVDEGNVKLDHEIEFYDDGDGELFAWVCIPSLSSSTDTVLYMYYGNPDCGNQQDPEQVWDSNFIGVYHMSESSGNVIDSTSNDRNIPVGNAPMYGENGKIAKCMQFDGNNDYFEKSNYYDVSTLSAVTLEIWTELPSSSWGEKYPYAVTLGRGHNYVQALGLRWVGSQNSASYKKFDMRAARYGIPDAAQSTMFNPGSGFYYQTGIYTNNYVTIYVDSIQYENNTASNNNFNDFTDDYIEIGRASRKYAGWEYHSGKFDEIRISKIVRSSEWISTSYNNQNDPESFIEFGEHSTNYEPIADFTYSKIGGLEVRFDGSKSYDPDGTIILYEWNFGDGNNGVGMFVNHIYSVSEIYDVTLTVTDNSSHMDDITKNIEVINHPPGKPLINGPPTGDIGETYSYTLLSIDPDEDDVYYEVDWGDGTVENWIGPYPSNEVQIVSHSWSNKGNYTIKARAKDIYGEIGEWESLEVSMPKNKPFNINPLFLRFLEQHPNLFPILRQLLGL